MKQILQNLRSGQTQLVEIPVPRTEKGYLLVRTRKSLISIGTERMLLDFGRAGLIGKARQQPEKVRQVMQKIRTDGLSPTINAVLNKLDQPLPLGYSNVGTIEEVGKGVVDFRIGERVVSNGPHAEFVCVPENLCAKIPESVDDVTASFTVLSAIALQGIRLANPTLGESVAVMGLGLIGLLACQILLANGCKVIGFDFDSKKIALAKDFGADAHDLSNIDPVEIAQTYSKGYGVDAVLITAATKSNDPILQAPRMCRQRGRVVLIGMTGLELSRDDFYKKEISFQVSCSYGPGRYDERYEKRGLDYPIGFVRWTERRNFEAILQLMEAGRIYINKLVSEVVPFCEISRAYERIVNQRDILGVVLDYKQETDAAKRMVDLERTVEKSPALRSAGGIEPVLGLIGAGNFVSATLLPALKGLNVRLKTIASSLGVSSAHAGSKYGFKKNTTDYRMIITDPEINTVVITTQHNSHARFVIAALEAGKHVFVEKPLCLTRGELDDIITAYGKAQENSHPLLMVGFNRRFSPLTVTMKKLLEPIPVQKSCVMTVNAGMIPSGHWTQNPEVGGGRIIGEACHFIDLVRFLIGHPIDVVHAVQIGGSSSGILTSDNATILMRFRDGSIGTVHYFANGHKSFPKERLEVFCNGKILQLDNFRRVIGYGWNGFSSKKLWTQDKGHKACISAFIDAIRNGKPSPIDMEELVEVTRMSLVVSELPQGNRPEVC